MNPEKYGGKNFKSNVPCKHFIRFFQNKKRKSAPKEKIWMRSTLKEGSLLKRKASAERACWQEDIAIQRVERQCHNCAKVNLNGQNSASITGG